MIRLSVDRASYAYGNGLLALSQASINVGSGEAIALVGPNGSGKSTLLRVASGSLHPDPGEVRLDGLRIQEMSRRQAARRLAFVEQERTISFDFTVREVVAMGRIPHHARFSRESRTDRHAIEAAMEWTDVASLSDRSIRTLSGGEGQRVHLARALAQEPAILLLDEPTTYLDLHHQVRFMSIVRESVAKGLSAVMAIHDLTIAAQAADRVSLMKKGRIVATGRGEEVLTSEAVRSVFEVDAIVRTDPDEGALYILPRLAREA